MNIIISNNSNEPLYLQIMNQIKAEILKENLKEGDLLPSIRNFASDLNVSVLTIRRVYRELEEEGFIVSQAGLGTFVSVKNIELLKDARYRSIESKLEEVVEMSKSLGVTKKDILEMLELLF